MLWATEMGTLRFVQPSMLSLAAGPSTALWEEQSLFLLSLQMSGVFPYTSVSPFMVCSFKNVCCKHLHSPTCSSTCHEKFGNVTRCFLSLVLIRLPSILKGNPLEPISGDCWSILPYLFLLEQHPQSNLKSWCDSPLLDSIPGACCSICPHKRSTHTYWRNEWRPSVCSRDSIHLMYVPQLPGTFLHGLTHDWVNLPQA